MSDLLTMDEDAALSSVKLIASDMDLTLLDDDGNMPPRMFDRIRALDEAGIMFCAASGRGMYTLRDMFGEVIDHMAFLSDNGAAVSCRGEHVSTSGFGDGACRALAAFTEEDGRGFANVCTTDACYVLKRYEAPYREMLSKFYSKIVFVDSFDHIESEVIKYTVCCPDLDADDLRGAYVDAAGEGYTVMALMGRWIDVMRKGVSKGSGLVSLCDYMGISVSDALAVGDTYNDIPMIEAAGHGYVVANAAEHMHAHAGFVCPSNNERGVAQIIDRILELA